MEFCRVCSYPNGHQSVGFKVNCNVRRAARLCPDLSVVSVCFSPSCCKAAHWSFDLSSVHFKCFVFGSVNTVLIYIYTHPYTFL